MTARESLALRSRALRMIDSLLLHLEAAYLYLPRRDSGKAAHAAGGYDHKSFYMTAFKFSQNLFD